MKSKTDVTAATAKERLHNKLMDEAVKATGKAVSALERARQSVNLAILQAPENRHDELERIYDEISKAGDAIKPLNDRVVSIASEAADLLWVAKHGAAKKK